MISWEGNEGPSPLRRGQTHRNPLAKHGLRAEPQKTLAYLQWIRGGGVMGRRGEIFCLCYGGETQIGAEGGRESIPLLPSLLLSSLLLHPLLSLLRSSILLCLLISLLFSIPRLLQGCPLDTC